MFEIKAVWFFVFLFLFLFLLLDGLLWFWSFTHPHSPPPLFVVESSGPGRGLVSADPLERGRERIGKGLQE